MEHEQRQGSQAEDGGLGSGLRDAHDGAPAVPGDGGNARGSSSIGLQRRGPVGDADLEAVLRAVPGSRQKLPQGSLAS